MESIIPLEFSIAPPGNLARSQSRSSVLSLSLSLRVCCARINRRLNTNRRELRIPFSARASYILDAAAAYRIESARSVVRHRAALRRNRCARVSTETWRDTWGMKPRMIQSRGCAHVRPTLLMRGEAGMNFRQRKSVLACARDVARISSALLYSSISAGWRSQLITNVGYSDGTI